MVPFRHLSIQRKLTLTILAATGAALLVACLSFGTYEFLSARKALLENARGLAEIVGQNCEAALLFDDTNAAQETLDSLRSEAVVAAAVYREDGTLFAHYSDPGAPAIPRKPGVGHVLGLGYLDLYHEIQIRGEQVGTVYIRADTHRMFKDLGLYLAISMGVLVFATALGSLLGNRLQRSISVPIAALVEGAEAIAAGDLGSLVPVAGDDEVGVLAASFNRMAESVRGVAVEVRENIRAVARVTQKLEITGELLVAETQRQAAAADDGGESVAQVTDSIQKVNESITQLAGSARETSTAVLAMDGSIGGIAQNMDQLTGSIETTSSAISELTASVTQIAASVGTLDEATGTTEESLRGLNSSVEQVRENAQKSHVLSLEASNEAERGMLSVQDTIASMHEIETSFKRLEETVSDLTERSESIGSILLVIEDIAEQTNLLSLNASIIGAQAGEHGRAFSVVAEEVNHLSEHTATSTREIAELIQGIRGVTRIAEQAVRDGAGTVETGVARSHEAGARLRAILDRVASSGEMVSEIVRATDTQTADLGRVDGAVAQVREIVEQVQHATREQTRASREIASMVEQMRELGGDVNQATDAQRRESQQITTAVERMTEMIEQVLSATRDQREGSEQIRAALRVFRDVGAQSAERAGELKSMMDTLIERSAQLDAEIGRFRLS